MVQPDMVPVVPALVGSGASRQRKRAQKEQMKRYTDPDGPTVTWVHGGMVVRAFKVVLNIYSLYSPTCNS